MATDPTGSVVRNLFLLQRLGNGLGREARGLLGDLFDDIAAEAARIDPTGVGAASYRQGRIRKLMAEVEALTGEAFDQFHKDVRQRLAEIGKQQGEWATGQLQATIGEIGVTVSSAATGINRMKAIIDADPFEGLTLRQWADNQDAATVKRVRRQIQLGMAQNETLDDIVRRVRGRSNGRGGFTGGVMETTTREAEAIARTGTNFVANRAHLETYQENSDVTKEYEYTATLDDRTTLICASLDGRKFAYDDPDKRVPPQHFRCLPGDSLVLSRTGVTGASKRWFDGKVVIFQTSAGRELTCTPNHPVLTDGGWVPAGHLDLGDHVICDGGGEWEGGVDSDDQNVPAPIHDVAESFLGSRGVLPVPVPVTSVDFHGDGVGSEVAVVASYGFLGNGGDAPLGEHRAQVPLVVGDMPVGQVPLSATGDLAPFRLGGSAPPNRPVGGTNETLPFCLAGSVHPGLLLLGAVSGVDAALAQNPLDDAGRDTEPLPYPAGADAGFVEAHDAVFREVGVGPGVRGVDASVADDAVDDLERDAMLAGNSGSGFPGTARGNDGALIDLRPVAPYLDPARPESVGDGGDADAKLARQIISGAPGPVFVDEIVHVEVQRFSDHVYNLETVGGFYAANGIITHNCRSSLVPVVDWDGLGVEPPPEGKRASADGPVKSSTTYEQWLDDQPPSVQNEIMGPGRAKLFRDGTSLSQMVKGDNSIVTLAELD